MQLHVVYGGTFDPVHRGHVAVAECVADALGCRVDLIPAADPPHRASPGASAAHRAAMLRLAIAGHPQLHVDERELTRPGASYSVDTLTELRAEIGPQPALIWVLGADALLGLASWRRWEQLLELGHLLAVERPGHPLDAAALAERAPAVAATLLPRQCAAVELTHRAAGGFAMLQPARPLPESASEVRLRLAEGGDWRALVPPAVADYIADNGLYGVERV